MDVDHDYGEELPNGELDPEVAVAGFVKAGVVVAASQYFKPECRGCDQPIKPEDWPAFSKSGRCPPGSCTHEQHEQAEKRMETLLHGKP
jgi:hypothetical protein